MDTFILILIGVIIGNLAQYVYQMITCKQAATLKIDTSEPNKDSYIFEANMPLEDLTKYSMIRVKIIHNTSANIDKPV